jgi:long-chain acyl-CoA synthetase
MPESLKTAGEAPVIISGERSRTHAEIRRNALRAASGFRDLGIGIDDCVALLLRNDFAFFEASLAAGFAGAYAVPINWHSAPEEARHVLLDCQAKAVVVHSDLLERLGSAIPDGVHVLVVETPPEIDHAYRVPLASPGSRPEAMTWETWLAGRAPLDDPNLDSRAAVIYTSGTTGRPKGVKREPDRTGRTSQAALGGYGLGSDLGVVLINGPLYHTAPNSYVRLAFGLGASIILEARFDAEELLSMIERYRVSHMHMVPTMFVRLLRLPEEVKQRYDLSSLRFVVHGAAPCPLDVKRAIIEWWGPVINEYYGATEAGLVTSISSADALRKPGSVGRPLPGVHIRIVGDTGKDLPAGETGDVYVASENNSAFTYIGLEAQRAEIALDEYVTVGDIGCLDGDGFLYLRDRRKDMIISGGVNIYPAEVEAALHAQSEVGDCAVFGIPDPEFGEAVCAYVQPAIPGAAIDIDQLKIQLGARLSRFKIPARIVVVDTLPREDSGKIFKRKLKAPYWT